ncbi:putative polysaccharide export protein, GfcE-like [Desulfonema limicola]|uniref:Polysaccharide export protein, GfcE-like n=1 Tax=Desulfonema limicola TaxID=45656 RepID=A0A975GFP8_9BACT|nr:FG-GAP-like repeat-containing protein [Desulfonema limicola]QTA79468.1 putative polysaccharide export protein, GfcE-like [Desulfonema limicola]
MNKKVICLIFILLIFHLPGCIHSKSRQNNTVFQPRFNAYGLPSSGHYRGLAAADLDNDGNPDIIGGASSAALNPGVIAIWYGNGTGHMSRPLFLPIKGEVRSIAIGDVNEDGLNDIIFSVRRESSGIKVWLNQPDRKWIKGISPVEGNNYEGVLAADINRDGHIDIIAANATTDSQAGIQVWQGDGRGNWPVESGPVGRGIFMDIACADFNNDGILDIAGSGWGTYGSLRVWLGTGMGGWSAIPHLKSGSYYALTAADINNDGHMDILAGTYKAGIRIFHGNGKGGFQMGQSPVNTGSFWKVVCADLDGDGRQDIIAGSSDSSGMRAWLGKEEVLWEPVYSFPDSGIYYAMFIADINKDGHNDLAAASFGEGIKFWPGMGGFINKPGIDPGDKNEFIDNQNKASLGEVEENDVFTSISGFPEYKIGPGDILEITMWKHSVGTKEEILVRPDGKISFGFVEDLKVSGLTAIQLDELLTEHLKIYIKHPQIDVIIKTYQSKFVTFAGEIYTNVTFRSGPGRYELKGKVTLLEMLSKVGGPTQNANLRDVRVRNKNGQAFSVNLYKTINFGDTSQDVIINDGDLIVIPAVTKQANRVYVFGEVIKPGVYTFSGSEMFLFDAISQAGGVSIFATPESTKVVRGDITSPEVISADLKALMEKGDRTQNVALASGDLVYVPRSFVGNVNVFVKQISPLINLIFTPARFRDEYYDW